MAAHPKAITEHRELVIKCLDGEDVSIRSRALDLLTGMVTKRNLIAVIAQLMTRLESAEADYADQLVEKIVAMCCQVFLLLFFFFSPLSSNPFLTLCLSPPL